MVTVSSRTGTAVGSRRRLGSAALIGALVAGLSLVGATNAAAVPTAASSPAATAPVTATATAAAAATVKVIPAKTRISYGSAVAVTVTAAGQNSGTITLRAGSRTIGTRGVSAGKATFTVPGTLPVGRQTLTATFSGGGSAAKAIDVVKVTPRYDIRLASANVKAGSPTKVTVSLSAGSAVVSGKVKILVNGTARAAARLSGGRAVLTIPGLSAGVHTVTGVYQGEGGANSATSPAVRLTSRGASSTVVTVSSSRVSYGSSFPITVTVKGPKGAASGRVDVLYGGSVLGMKMLSGGKATWTAPASRVPGRYTITARYAGAGTALPSVTNKAVDVVKAAPSVSASLAASSIRSGAKGTVRFTISGRGATPTGTYKVLVDGKGVSTGNVSAGQRTVTLPALSGGTHSVVVRYNGDGKYAATTSAAQRLTVAAAGPSNPCSPSARACIDLTNDLTWIQQNGQIVYGPVPITSGRPGYRTNAGMFQVYWKDKDHRSSIFDDAPMPNSVFFDGGIAFHEGSLYVTSHGCIHLSWAASEYYFNNLDYGDVVHVFGYAPY